MRTFGCSAAAAVLLGATTACGVQAQSYPSRPVRVIVQLAPGGSMDTLARALALKLTEATGQNFIVDNRPGAGSAIGLETAAAAPADGHTIVVVSATTGVYPILYNGMGAAYADLIAGNIELSFPTIVSSQTHLKSGRLRGLAVTLPKRAPAVPDLPTMAEAGVKGVVVTNWYGVLAPAATPRPVVERLNREVVRIMRQPEMRKRLIADGSEAVGGSSEEFRRHIAAERSQWARVIDQAGIRGQ